MDQHPNDACSVSAQGATFKFAENIIRTIVRDGELWFVAADVCKALGLANTSGALGSLNIDEKSTVLAATKGGIQKLLSVNELGLYRVIFRSDKHHARDLQRWLIHEGVPAIKSSGRRGFERDAGEPRSGIDINVVLPAPGLYLIDARADGSHVIQRTSDDHRAVMSLRLDYESLLYAVESIHALWTLLRLRLPHLSDKRANYRIQMLDDAITGADFNASKHAF